MTREATYCTDIVAALGAFGYDARGLSPGSSYRVTARRGGCTLDAAPRSVIRKRLGKAERGRATERELARIWDCGKIRWVKHL